MPLSKQASSLNGTTTDHALAKEDLARLDALDLSKITSVKSTVSVAKYVKIGFRAAGVRESVIQKFVRVGSHSVSVSQTYVNAARIRRVR